MFLPSFIILPMVDVQANKVIMGEKQNVCTLITNYKTI